MVGDWPGYGTVWKSGIANILSLANVMKKHAVVFNSGSVNKFVVKNKNQQVEELILSSQKLVFIYHDIAKSTKNNQTLVITTDKDRI